MVLALCHLLNCIFGYFGWNNVILGYISGISILTVSYLYLVSYLIKLCGYYRMFLHYCVITSIVLYFSYTIYTYIKYSPTCISETYYKIRNKFTIWIILTSCLILPAWLEISVV